MRIVHHALSAHAVELLQVVSDLREDLSPPRTREVADVRGHDGSVAPGQRHGGFHEGTDRECGGRRGLREAQLERCGTASEPRGRATPARTRTTGSSAGRAMTRL